MPQIKLRVGEVSADESIPNLAALKQEAEEAGIQGGRGDRKYADEIIQTDDYLYLYYTQEVTEERPQFVGDEDNGEEVEVKVDDTFVARSMRFILRDDNYYAFEATREVYGEDALHHILHDTELIGLECSRQETFPQEWMESFYNRTNSIRKAIFKNIGEYDSENYDEDIEDLAKEVGDPTERAEFSTSGRDNNLRTSDLINALSEVSDIDFVSGMDAQSNLSKLNKSGRLTFSHPANLDHEGQAERMYDATERILGNIGDD